MQNITRLKAYFQKNPLMGFVAVIVFITIFLGIGAFIGTRPKNSADSDKLTPTPTEEVEEEDSSMDEDIEESDTDASEHKAEPTDVEEKATPTKSATSTPAATATPTGSPKININLLGDIYEDLNCNGTRDSGENAVTKTLTVNIYKMPEFSAYTSVTTDSSGHYSYNSSIDKDASLQLKIGPVSPEGYKSNPKVDYPTSTLNKDTPTARVDVPQVPNDKVGACSS
jgi:hypothetical protein